MGRTYYTSSYLDAQEREDTTPSPRYSKENTQGAKRAI